MNPPPAPNGSRLAVLRRRWSPGWATRPRLLTALLIAVMAAPPVYVLLRTADARRDLVYWDEFDTVLAFILKLKESSSPGTFLQELFALNNEHRMVTSRLIYAVTYWLTGSVNFVAFDWIGLAWIFVTCGLLVAAVGSGPRRLRLGVLLALLLFQLEHYENYLWSGASIDHFQVVMLVAGAVVAVARGTQGGVLAGSVLATLATYTLAHGMMAWPIGALFLWQRANRRGLVTWCAAGALAVGTFLTGFKVNSAQSFAAFTFEGGFKIFEYWLSILGAVPALGHQALQPLLGGAFLILLAFAAWRGALRREPVALPLAAYAAAAAGLIAFGRAEDSGGVVHSRYYVLGGVAWALTLFMLLARHSHPRRPLRPLLLALPALAAFNFAANRGFVDETDSWLEARDRAVTRFMQYGVDGRGAFSLHPNPEHATELLKKAEDLGVYRLGQISRSRPFPTTARLSNRLAYFVDEMTVNARAAFVRGWVAIPGLRSQRGQIHLILRSEKETHLFTTVSTSRPDVATATKNPHWAQAGFRFARRRDRLPTGEYQIGFLLQVAGKSEYVMTAHRVNLVGEGKALLATGN